MLPGNRQQPLGSSLAAKQYGWFAHAGMYASSLVSIIEDRLGPKQFCCAAPEQAYSVNTPPLSLFAINTSEGLTEQTITLWASILPELTGWILRLDTSNIDMQAAVKTRFVKHHIHHQQISFHPKVQISKGCLVLENLVNNGPLNTYLALQKSAAVVAEECTLGPHSQTAAKDRVNKHQCLCKTVPKNHQQLTVEFLEACFLVRYSQSCFIGAVLSKTRIAESKCGESCVLPWQYFSLTSPLSREQLRRALG